MNILRYSLCRIALWLVSFQEDLAQSCGDVRKIAGLDDSVLIGYDVVLSFVESTMRIIDSNSFRRVTRTCPNDRCYQRTHSSQPDNAVAEQAAASVVADLVR